MSPSSVRVVVVIVVVVVVVVVATNAVMSRGRREARLISHQKRRRIPDHGVPVDESKWKRSTRMSHAYGSQQC